MHNMLTCITMQTEVNEILEQILNQTVLEKRKICRIIGIY